MITFRFDDYIFRYFDFDDISYIRWRTESTNQIVDDTHTNRRWKFSKVDDYNQRKL